MAFIDPTDTLNSNALQALEQVAGNSHEGIAIISSGQKIEYVNDQVCHLLGREKGEILGQGVLSFVHKDDSHVVLDRYCKWLDGVPIGKEFEIRMLHAQDGVRHVHVRTSVLRDNEGRTKILAQVLDITEQRLTRQTLSEREATFQTLVNTMNEGLGVIDDGGTVIYANAALCRMVGFSEHEMVGKSTADIMRGPDLDAVFDKIRNRIAGRCDRYETRLVHASGSTIPVTVSASPVVSESGQYLGSCAVFSDSTEQRMMKMGLESARDKAVLYLDLMRHDIRNYLQEIQLAAEIIEIKSGDTVLREMASSICEAVRRSTKVIAESRTIEQLERVPLQERILDEVLHEVMKDSAILMDEVEASVSLHVTDVHVIADEYLEVMLSDLLTFAYRRSRKEMRRIWVDLTEQEGIYELCISDDGPALPRSVMEDPLDHRLRLEGVSLHLAQYIVRKYGGDLQLTQRDSDDEGRRTTIRATIPKVAR
jgi:PAS domain S-box-containing protein